MGSTISVIQDGVTKTTATNAEYTQGGTGLDFYSSGAASYEVDWLIARKSAANEPTVSFSSEEVGAGPVAYWKLDEGQGQVVNDSSSRGNHATLGLSSSSASDDPTWVNEDLCVSGKCLQFLGDTTVVGLANGGNIKYSDGFSVSMWFYGTSFSTPDAPELFTARFTGTNKWASLRVGYNNELEFQVQGPDGGLEINSPNGHIVENKWYHVTAVYDPSGTSKLFIDGVQMSETSTVNAGTLTLNGVTTIGRGFNSWEWNGRIDEVKVYQYPRSEAQVKEDFNQGAASMGGQNLNFLSNGLVGYWKMDEASWNGTAGEVKDASGNGNNGTAVGNASTGAGKFGSGGAFDGDGDEISVADTSSLDIKTGSMSWSFWFKTAATDRRGLYRKSNGSNTGGVLIDIGSGAVGRVRCYVHNSPSVSTLSTQNTYNDNQWHHLSCVLNRETMKLELYLDGVLNATSDASGLAAVDLDAGNVQIADVGGFNLNGSMDEVRVHNRALSSAEVQSLYKYAPGPVGHWKFDEGSGTTAMDSSGNALNSTSFTGNPTWVSGKYGKALAFDGTSQSVNFGNVLGITGNVTAEVWVKWNEFKNYGVILEKGTGGSATSFNYAIWSYASSVNAIIGNGTSNNTVSVNASALSTGRWYHLALVADGSTLKLYIDGKVAASTTQTITPTANSSNFSIGNATSTPYNVNGSIDDVRIYNYALSPEQVATVKNEGAAMRFAE